MKRLAISEFDDDGNKSFPSPRQKEVKIGMFGKSMLQAESKQEPDPPSSFHLDTKLRRDKFYDFLRRATINGEPRINIEDLNKNLTIKVEELPDSSKISMIFEDLDSKSSLASRGKKNWSEQEITFFVWLVMNYCYLNKLNYIDMNDKEWDKIAENFPGRNAEQCKLRWQSLLKMNLSKAPWTLEEDEILVQVINDKGPKKWKEIAIELNKRLGNLKVFRQGKQCRERWINHLDPAINRGAWSSEEDIKLLETHLQIGKRWAEIAKILKTRTENAVKNRWNSLIKKYKNEFDLDSDAMSTSSNHSNSSINEIEKKISELIISQKRKRPNETSPNQDIPEMPEEEESPEESSEGGAGENSQKQISETSDRKMEEEKVNVEKKVNQQPKNKKKLNGAVDVTKQKNMLLGMVTQEIDERSSNQGIQQEKVENINPIFPPPASKNMQDNLNNLQNLFPGNLFGLNPNSAPLVSGLIQHAAQDPLQNQNAFSLLGQFNQMNAMNAMNAMNSMNPLTGLGNDMLNMNLNLWKANSPQLNQLSGINNFFSKNIPQNDLAANFLGMYANNRSFPQNTSNLTNLLPTSQNFLAEQNNSLPNSLGNIDLLKTESKMQQETSKNNTEDEKEPARYQFTAKDITQLVIPDVPRNTLQHAIADTELGFIYFMNPVTAETSVTKNRSNSLSSSFNGLDILGNSPAMGSRSWTSPPLHANPLFNPALNQQLANLGLGRTAISPSMGLIHDSPGLERFFQNQNQNFNVDTPENNAKNPLYLLNNNNNNNNNANSNSTNRNRVINQIDQEKALGIPTGNPNIGFAKRPSLIGDKSKNNSFSTSESSKFDSPSSSFMEANQARVLNLKSGEPAKVSARQFM